MIDSLYWNRIFMPLRTNSDHNWYPGSLWNCCRPSWPPTRPSCLLLHPLSHSLTSNQNLHCPQSSYLSTNPVGLQYLGLAYSGRLLTFCLSCVGLVSHVRSGLRDYRTSPSIEALKQCRQWQAYKKSYRSWILPSGPLVWPSRPQSKG